MLVRSEQLDPRSLGLWAIEEGRAFAGVCGLQPVSGPLEHEALMKDGIEPLIAIHPSAWGRGFATRAMEAMIDHARRACGLPRLVAAVDEPNERSHRMLERCRFSRTGTMAGPKDPLVLYELRLK